MGIRKVHIIYTVQIQLGTNVISALPQRVKEENRNAAENHKMYRDEAMTTSINQCHCLFSWTLNSALEWETVASPKR